MKINISTLAQIDLGALVLLYKNPEQYRETYSGELRVCCQKVSAWIEHGRITNRLRKKMKIALQEAETLLEKFSKKS